MKRKNGFSLLEVIASMAIMFLVTPLLVNLLIDIQKNSSSNIASSVQKQRDKIGIARLGRILNSSAKFVARDFAEAAPAGAIGVPSSISTFYLKTIGLPTTFQNQGENYVPVDIRSRVLPVYDPNGTFEPQNIDPLQFKSPFNTSNVGNSIMCITAEDYLTYPFDADGNYSATGKFKRRFPLYQVHYFFLAKTNSSAFAMRKSTISSISANTKFGLFEWKSKYFVDYNDLNFFVTCGGKTCGVCGFGGGCTINATSSSILTSFLANVNVNSKPDLMKNIKIAGIIKQSESLYAANTPIAFPLDNVGGLAAPSIVASKKLTGDQYTGANAATSIPQDMIENVLRYPNTNIAYGIAPNNFDTAAPSNYTLDPINRVPFFKGIDSASGDGFPHGFEVMLSGTSGSTKAFVKMMTLASGNGVYSYNPNMIVFQGKN